MSEEAISIILKIAGELILKRDIPDPDLPEFRPMGKNAIRALCVNQRGRARRLKMAVDLIRANLEKPKPKQPRGWGE